MVYHCVHRTKLLFQVFSTTLITKILILRASYTTKRLVYCIAADNVAKFVITILLVCGFVSRLAYIEHQGRTSDFMTHKNEAPLLRWNRLGVPTHLLTTISQQYITELFYILWRIYRKFLVFFRAFLLWLYTDLHSTEYFNNIAEIF